MIYKPKHHNEYKFRKKLSIYFLGLVIFCLIFFYFGSFLSKTALTIVSPMARISNGVKQSFNYGFEIFRPKASLITENAELKSQIENSRQKNEEYNALVEENNFLKEKLLQSSSNFVQAVALSFPPTTPYDILIIDKGSADKVLEGARVFVSDKILLGTLESVSLHQSRLQLFSSPGIKTEVISERTGDNVLLSGNGGKSFSLTLPLGFDIKEGDLFFLPGADKYIVAKATKVEQEGSSSFLSAYLEIPVPVSGKTLLNVEI